MAEQTESFKDILVAGLWSSNPVFGLVLGMCPTLAVTSSMSDGLGMGMAASARMAFWRSMPSLPP